MAFYAFVDVSALEGSSVNVTKRFISDQGVVTVPGRTFDDRGEGHRRLSFANDRDRLELGPDRLEEPVRTERSAA